ncbi:MAG TPA: hypothetical protein VEI01_02680 [Terriglobales bacterium]|nr:hypothetical protein [Terriglobales bacterium]
MNASLADITVSRAGAAAVFDFSEWKSEVASKKNSDGTVYTRSLSDLFVVEGMH